MASPGPHDSEHRPSAPRSLPRLLLMAAGFMALLAGMYGGLVRAGWGSADATGGVAAMHGPLMVCGFLGTVIGLERAVAVGRFWAYGAPALTAAGTLVLLVQGQGSLGAALMTAGSVMVVALFARIIADQPALFTVTMGLGAMAWAVGNGLWLAGRLVPGVVGWWMAFLVLTIAGERLDLSRMLRPPRASHAAFVVIIAALVASVAAETAGVVLGGRLTGVGLVALALWLLRYDVARRTVRVPGLPRFTAVCLLSGYAWLVIGGLLAAGYGARVDSPQYDGFVHAIFLGFVFAMIFGHAPIIFPAVLRLPVPFRSRYYAHLVVLHFSLIVRVLGDLQGAMPVRRLGAWLNVVAVLLFLANTIMAVRSGVRAAGRPHGPAAAIPERSLT